MDDAKVKLEVIIKEDKSLSGCIEDNFTKRCFRCVKKTKACTGKQLYSNIFKKPGEV